ncbi:MAG: hypothetical protein K8I82_11530 [Anaerolineae bacterium]|nr:hypothetical protein [Anaerolineae bacterium]
MYIQIDYSEAIAELMGHDDLPDALQLPAFLLAMELEYGSRSVARGRIRRLVERHLIQEQRAVTETPGYEPVALDIHTRFSRDVHAVAARLDYDPNVRKVLFYWPTTRQYYHSPRIIAEIFQREGKPWVTERHVKEAASLIRQQHGAA